MGIRQAARRRNHQTEGRFSLIGALVAALLIAAPAASQDDCRLPTEEEEIAVELINEQRALHGLGPVEIDTRLVASATRHSLDMQAGCFLSHTGSDGSSASGRMSDTGYPSPLGETAGAGQVSPAQIVQGWMNSSGHRAILLHASATHVGVSHAWDSGVCQLSPYDIRIAQHWWTANFGRSGQAPMDASACGGAQDAGPPACSDGIDNDGDGYIDVGQDMDCMSPEDTSELPVCSDGIDNDGDGRIDHPADDGCATPDQFSESDPACGLGFELVVLLPAILAGRRRRSAA